MAENEVKCKICNKEDFKYVCPRCNINYCSVTCYKSPDHISCSEKFFRQCVQEEMTLREAEDAEKNNRKMQDILTRLNTNDKSFYDDFLEEENIDSQEEDIDSDDNDGCDDIASRLDGIDINNSDEIWNRLTAEERQDFKTLLENGEILKLVPSCDPWWNKVELIEELVKDTTLTKKSNHPKILKNIAPFESISKVKPSPCLLHNISNILASYTLTYRYLNGEFQTNIIEAAAHLILLSANLKSNANFDDLEQAIKSAIIEGQNENLNVSLDEYQLILDDVNAILKKKEHQLEALSDIHLLLKSAKVQQSNQALNKCDKEFSSQFLSTLKDLKKIKIHNLIKKIEFFLSYIQSNYT